VGGGPGVEKLVEPGRAINKGRRARRLIAQDADPIRDDFISDLDNQYQYWDIIYRYTIIYFSGMVCRTLRSSHSSLSVDFTELKVSGITATIVKFSSRGGVSPPIAGAAAAARTPPSPPTCPMPTTVDTYGKWLPMGNKATRRALHCPNW
jgi:hypothetical protein